MIGANKKDQKPFPILQFITANSVINPPIETYPLGEMSEARPPLPYHGACMASTSNSDEFPAFPSTAQLGWHSGGRSDIAGEAAGQNSGEQMRVGGYFQVLGDGYNRFHPVQRLSYLCGEKANVYTFGGTSWYSLYLRLSMPQTSMISGGISTSCCFIHAVPPDRCTVYIIIYHYKSENMVSPTYPPQFARDRSSEEGFRRAPSCSPRETNHAGWRKWCALFDHVV